MLGTYRDIARYLCLFPGPVAPTSVASHGKNFLRSTVLPSIRVPNFDLRRSGNTPPLASRYYCSPPCSPVCLEARSR